MKVYVAYLLVSTLQIRILIKHSVVRYENGSALNIITPLRELQQNHTICSQTYYKFHVTICFVKIYTKLP